MSFADKLKARYAETMEVLANPKFAPDHIAELRLKICEDCPNLNKQLYQCKECGCFMKIKVKLAVAHCPLPEPKWGKYENK